MGLFDRIVRVVSANFNSLVSAAEDPEKILEQAVMDLQEDLVQLRQAVAGAIASQKRTERQYTQTQSTAEEWYRRAQLALQKGDEHLAKVALSRRKIYQETAVALKSQIDQQSVVVNQLKQNMRLLENKIADAKTKKDMYIARARSAQASEKLNELVGQINAGGTVSAFERMEEKVLQLEARSQAIADLGADTLEKQFASLEGSSDVDAELANLKSQMLKSSNPQKLPPSV